MIRVFELLQAWFFKNTSKKELEKFVFLAVIFSLTIGIYWLLRPLKDSIFMNIVGENYIPYAKILSVLVILPLGILYSKLVDLFPRQHLFYALCTIYGIFALIFAFLILDPATGLANEIASPTRWWGWCWYIYVESFATLIVALFWAFVADTTTPEPAMRGYPIIAFGGQLGNVMGPIISSLILYRFTVAQPGPDGELFVSGAESAPVLAAMVAGTAGGMALIMLLIYIFMRVIPKSQLGGYHGKLVHDDHHAKTGFFEGLRIILSSPYLLGIFALIFAYEGIMTILDFNFKTMVKLSFAGVHAQTVYLNHYALWVGIISLSSIALGINKIQRWLGLGASLALLPVLIACAVITFKAYPVIGGLFWIMVFSKAINFALNQPSMKQLYIPTTKEAKYKSQAFIEMYGARGSKAAASGINSTRGWLFALMGQQAGLTLFITLSTIVSLGVVGVWFFIALFLGKTYKKAVERNEVIV